MNIAQNIRQILQRSSRLRTNAAFIPKESFEKRKQHFNHADNGVLSQTDGIPQGPVNVFSNPDMMMGQMNRSVTGILPNMLLMGVISFIFSGFVVGACKSQNYIAVNLLDGCCYYASVSNRNQYCTSTPIPFIIPSFSSNRSNEIAEWLISPLFFSQASFLVDPELPLHASKKCGFKQPRYQLCIVDVLVPTQLPRPSWSLFYYFGRSWFDSIHLPSFSIQTCFLVFLFMYALKKITKWLVSCGNL